jgi:hypothetical protein
VIRSALLCLTMLLVIAGADSPCRADQPIGAAEASIEDQWREQLLAAHQEVIRARMRHEAALDAYQLMRHRHRKRGEPKRLILEELKLSEAAVPIAEQELETLTEAARRAGVPPGSLRFDATDLAPVASD